jgi:hypothetical protein
MDVKCVRVLRPYEGTDASERVIYIDEDAKYSLIREWGSKIMVRGRFDAKEVEIRPLKAFDQQGFIARASQSIIDEAYIEYGEEVQLIS